MMLIKTLVMLFSLALFLEAGSLHDSLAKKNTSTKNPLVILETTQGKITLELFPKIAPKAVENFVTHVKNGYYNGVLFHRIIKGFMIQSGDPTGTGRGGESIWKKPFANEYAPNVTFNKKGILAMAKTSAPVSQGSQFFITVNPTPHLNGGYTIFGEVKTGYESVKRLELVPTTRNDRPIDEQKILKAYLLDK